MVKLDIESVQDANGVIWVTKIKNCQMAKELPSEAPRSMSPEQYKGARIGRAAEYGDTTSLVAQSLDSGFDASRPSRIGRNSDKRVERRANRQALPDEDMVKEIMSGGSRNGSRNGSRGGSRGGRSISPARATSRGGTAEVKISESHVTSQGFHVPGARLGTDVPIAESTSMFGSTQLSGCQGDFCKFDLGYIENTGVLALGGRDNTLSEFRQKLLASDGPVTADEKGLTSHLTNLMKGT